MQTDLQLRAHTDSLADLESSMLSTIIGVTPVPVRDRP